MASLQPIDKFMHVITQIGGVNERAAVIVAGGMVENYLGWAITSRLRASLSNTMLARLFENGPLSEFSAKIDFGFVLNLYGENPRADLGQLRRIRNLFAHRLDVENFDDPEVMKHCRSLKAPAYLLRMSEPNPYKPPVVERTPEKQQFMDTAFYLANGLGLQVTNPLPPPDPVALVY
jgi:hypothetical protein